MSGYANVCSVNFSDVTNDYFPNYPYTYTNSVKSYDSFFRKCLVFIDCFLCRNGKQGFVCVCILSQGCGLITESLLYAILVTCAPSSKDYRRGGRHSSPLPPRTCVRACVCVCVCVCVRALPSSLPSRQYRCDPSRPVY